MRWLAFLLLIGTAWAQATPTSVEELAQAAAEAHEVGCGASQVDDPTAAGQAIASVSALLPRIDAGVQATGSLALLYWRGMLQMCIGREEFAEADLRRFVADAGSDPTLQGMVTNARRQVRLLGGGPEAPRRPLAGPALLIAGAGSAAAFGGVAGWQAGVLGEKRDRYVHPWQRDVFREGEDVASLAADAQRAAVAANVFTGLAAGVGGALELVGIVLTAREARPKPVAVVPWVAPGVAAIGLGGRW